jgi:hypothetical protein
MSPGPQGTARSCARHLVDPPAVPAPGAGAFYRTPAPASDDNLGLTTPDRRAVHGVALPGLAADGTAGGGRACGNRKRVQRLMRLMGVAATGPQTAHQQANAGASDLFLSVARHDH